MSDPYTEKAKRVLEENIFMVISSASKTGEPWVTPVYFAYDSNFHFYWISAKEARHSQLVKENPLVSIVIFDSHVAEGGGKGVYIQAKGYELDQDKDIAYGANLIYTRQQKPVRSENQFMWDSPRRIYKAIPEKFWMNTGEYEGEYFIDKRIEVFPLK